MNLSTLVQAFKTPQGAVSVLVTVITILGTVGLLNADLTTSLEVLCNAVLGVIMAVTHATVTTKLIQRAVSQAEADKPSPSV